tara:strand:+ start:1877 stop:2788 length:912 start_codon:yes stop_codon:yes gene_type:complete
MRVTGGFFTLPHPKGWVVAFIQGSKVPALVPMDANDLLAVSPKLLAQAILHRRERIAEMIPNDLDERRLELSDAEPKAKAAREERNSINSKVANLKKERNEAQKEARALFEKANSIREQLISEGGIKNPDPKWAQEKLSAKLQELENKLETSAGNHKTEEKFINEMKSLIKEHEEWVEERTSSQPLVKEMKETRSKAINLINTAQKAHDAMVELADANAERHESYVKWEEVRVRASSRTKRLENALSSSQDALEFWKTRVESDNFQDLMTDALRVKSGGQSSKAIARDLKKARQETASKEEEE